MQLFVTILHVFLCVSLILIILLQPGKEGAAAFGGGASNQMYGPRGQGHFLGKATTAVAARFMFTSITLALYSSTRVATDSDIEEGIDQLPGDEESGFQIDLPTVPGGTDATPAPAPLPPTSPEDGLDTPTAPDSLDTPAPEGGAIEQLQAPAPAPTGTEP